MQIVTEYDGSMWANLDDVISFVESRFVESCDCDKTKTHDCICPHCLLRFLKANAAQHAPVADASPQSAEPKSE